MIFFVLVLYTMATSVGNGGEYWGYDGRKEPRTAAYEAVLAGDYRFLDVNLRPYQDELTAYTPGLKGCSNYLINELDVRRSSVEPMHTEDSLKLASRFAQSYNQEIVLALNRDRDAKCLSSWSY